MPRAARDPATARLDGRRVLFAVRQDGVDVRCAISLNALQDISERRYVKPAEVLQCFAAAQPRIEAAVREIGLPCVIKPVMSSSGKGQSTVRALADVAAAWDYALVGARGRSARVIIEGFVDFDSELAHLFAV